MEHPKRSIAKAISWRLTGTIDTMIISWLVTGSPLAAISIGVFELVTKTLLYYGHERVWNRISFGKDKSEVEYHI